MRNLTDRAGPQADALSTKGTVMIIDRRLVVLAPYVLSVLATGAEAIADDAKTFPGAMCQPTVSTDLVIRNDATGWMINPGGPTQIWICPIVRDTMEKNSGEFAALTIGHHTRVKCTLETRSFFGDFPVSRLPDDPEPPLIFTSPPAQRFTYALGNTNFEGQESGIYYFRCEVPAGGFIFSYQVEEDE
jgi:hypothetical protein